tara:strand:- start:13613 stop:14827 length:1215 start_codon:yes stop_codon:yes gene_type:complete
MATTNTPTTLVSRLKEIYPDGPSNLIPNSTELQKRLNFRADIGHGEHVRFDVQLTHEHGFSVGQGSITLGGAVAQETAKATVEGYSVILQSRVSYDLVTRAKTDKKAFAKFSDSKFIPMVDSFQKRCEIYNIGYSRQSLGKVVSNTSGALVISNDTWCAALWAGSKGTVLEAFTDVAAGTQHDTDLTISAVDIANKTVTVTGTSTAVVQDDLLFYKDHAANGPYGLTDIAANAGTLYGISAVTYELWKAQTYDVGTSALTLGKILEASGQAAEFGAEDLTCLCPIKAFQSLVSDEAALRQYGNFSKKGENGFEQLSFHGANGTIEVVPYRFIKDGEAIMFPEKWTYRIGSSDVTNRIAKDGDIMFDLESTSDKEMRMFADFTVFCERPSNIVRMTRSDSLGLQE